MTRRRIAPLLFPLLMQLRFSGAHTSGEAVAFLRPNKTINRPYQA